MTTINGKYPWSFVTERLCNQMMATTVKLSK